MDDVVHRLSRELADAIGGSIAGDPKVEACRERARAAGYEMEISLEAVICFGSRGKSQILTKVMAPKKAARSNQPSDITADDRKFLNSIRIASDEQNQ